MVSISNKRCCSRAMLDLIIWSKTTMHKKRKLYAIVGMLFILICLCGTNNRVLEFIYSSHPSCTSMHVMQTSINNLSHTWNHEDSNQEVPGLDMKEGLNRTTTSTDGYCIHCLSH